MHTDVENYLINSRHRTVDRKKMSCYRQFIRGYNFHKEGYVHNIMMNNISTENPFCYVRSKCFASMKKEVYTQWLLLTKTVPVTIVKDPPPPSPQSFFYSFITILPSESGATLEYSTIFTDPIISPCQFIVQPFVA